jgi:Predicted redox protein, regulator of disulfide bond formation
MSNTSEVTYLGDLRTSAIHLRSSRELITDAPTDNNGKGEAFSPTDLVATSLASCMITIMGIRAAKMNLDVSGIQSTITKIMTSNPRRIAEIKVDLKMPARTYEAKDKKILEAAARTCPVALSLHPDIVQTVSFHW